MESKLCEEQFKNFGEEIEKYEKLYQQMKNWKSSIESEMKKKDDELERILGLARNFEKESGIGLSSDDSSDLFNVYPEQKIDGLSTNQPSNEDDYIMADIYDNDKSDRSNLTGDITRGIDNPMLTSENRSVKSDEDILYEEPLIGSDDIKRADGTKIIVREKGNVDNYTTLLKVVQNEANYKNDTNIKNLINRLRKYKFAKIIDHDRDSSLKKLGESFLEYMKYHNKNPRDYGVGKILNTDPIQPIQRPIQRPRQRQIQRPIQTPIQTPRQDIRNLISVPPGKFKRTSSNRGGKSKKFKRTRKKY